jgi:hypothetical protein
MESHILELTAWGVLVTCDDAIVTVSTLKFIGWHNGPRDAVLYMRTLSFAHCTREADNKRLPCSMVKSR